MSKQTFDKKFGEDFLTTVPREPGVYRYFSAKDVLVYVGKAKDLRKRLTGYRNATRKKAHRKMRRIVRAAARLEIEVTASEEEALLLENAVIKAQRPRLNVEGAFSFLYPVIGIKRSGRHLHIAYSTMADDLADHDFLRFGCYRNRGVARAGFEALERAFTWLGHLEGAPELVPYTAWRRFRQIPKSLDADLEAFLKGDSDAFLEALVFALLDRPAARRDSADVQESVRDLKAFYDTECVRLARLREATGWDYIPQEERDAAAIRLGFSEA